jgi:hypothetical protein
MIREIEVAEQSKIQGAVLLPAQLEKIDRKASILEEIEKLEKGGDAKS